MSLRLKNLSEALRKRLNLVLIILLLILLFMMIFLLPVRSLDGSLLQALFQGMITLFGLLFSGSLVVAQLLARYSFWALKLVVLPRLMVFSLPFVVAIVLPLTASLFSPEPWTAKVCVICDLLVLSLMFLFFHDVLNFLRPDSMIKSLGERARRRFENQEEVRALDDIARNALLRLRDYESFSLVLRELKVLYFLGSENVQQNFFNLCNMALKDPWAFHFACEAMADFGREAVKAKRETAVKLVLEKLESEFLEAVRKDNILAAVSLVSIASEMELSLAEQVLDETLRNIFSRVITVLEQICHHAVGQEIWKPAFEAAGALLDFGAHLLEDPIAQQVAEALREVKKTRFGEKVVINAVKARLGREEKDNVRQFLKRFLPDICQRFGWK